MDTDGHVRTAETAYRCFPLGDLRLSATVVPSQEGRRAPAPNPAQYLVLPRLENKW